MPEVIVEREETARATSHPYASTSRKIIPVYPGEEVKLGLNIYGPRGHVVEVIVENLSSVAEITVSPHRAEAPYSASVVIEVLSSAKPGLYPFDVKFRDESKGITLGVEHMALLVLRKNIPRELAKHYSTVKQIFVNYGSNGLIWYALKHVFPGGADFRRLKDFYELVVGRGVSKGTISNVLSRMVKKGIITRIRGEEGTFYRLLVEDFDVVVTRIDVSRIRFHSSKQTREERRSEDEEPYPVRLAFERALDIKFNHGVLPATIFLAHTLVGVRETGFLLYWSNDMFITCENKTGFCHVFHSPLLAYYFRILGVKPGVFYSQTQEYLEAWRIARRYIRKHYKTFPMARRLHFLLKREDLIWYDEEDEALVLDVYYYRDGSIGVRARE